MTAHGHVFAAMRAQPATMRRSLRPLTVLAGAALLLCVGVASAQTSDAPVSTAGSRAGGAPVDAGPATVGQTPSPPPVQPARDISDFETAADHGRRAPLLGEYHGEVGAMVGTNGLRGAYGRIIAHPNDHMAIDLRFSTIHQNGGIYGGYGGYGYGSVSDPGARYRTHTRTDLMSDDPMAPPEADPPAH
jgi:hypothetical protein